MSPRSDDEIDFLLSRGKLGGSQRERILEAAVAASREGFWARWRGRLAWSTAGLTLAAGAAALLLMLRPAHDGPSGFQVKGSGDAALITVACLGAQVSACPTGSKLAFALEGGRDQGGFLTAYADRLEPGDRVWYLTNEPVGAPAGDGATRVIPKAALIGGDGQPPGAYRVHAIFTRGPVARDGLVRLAATEILSRADLDMVVPQ